MSNCLVCYQDAGDAAYHPRCAKRIFGIGNMPQLELNKDLLRELAEKTVSRHIAVTGVQPKLSLDLQKVKGHDRLTIVGLWGRYMLKPRHEQYPSMPEVEDLTMHLAEIFGIITCDHTLLRASDGSLVYIARRFDRDGEQKIHMEDFCQLSEFPTENKYKGSYERAGKLILRYSTQAGLDAIRYFELLLFCYLSANSDMHLKNFSLLYKGDNIMLSPAYDLVNVRLIYPKDAEETALLFNGRTGNLKLNDFEHMAGILGIHPKVMENTVKKFASRNVQVHQLIDASFLNDDMKHSYKAIWNDRQQIFT